MNNQNQRQDPFAEAQDWVTKTRKQLETQPDLLLNALNALANEQLPLLIANASIPASPGQQPDKDANSYTFTDPLRWSLLYLGAAVNFVGYGAVSAFSKLAPDRQRNVHAAFVETLALIEKVKSIVLACEVNTQYGGSLRGAIGRYDKLLTLIEDVYKLIDDTLSACTNQMQLFQFPEAPGEFGFRGTRSQSVRSWLADIKKRTAAIALLQVDLYDALSME